MAAILSRCPSWCHLVGYNGARIQIRWLKVQHLDLKATAVCLSQDSYIMLATTTKTCSVTVLEEQYIGDHYIIVIILSLGSTMLGIVSCHQPIFVTWNRQPMWEMDQLFIRNITRSHIVQLSLVCFLTIIIQFHISHLFDILALHKMEPIHVLSSLAGSVSDNFISRF